MDLHYLTIAEASALIKAGKLSPVELTQAYLDRIAAYDGQLNAYLLPLGESALATARKAEAEIAAGGWKGPLHGIPIGLKDIYNTAGVRTTGHSALFKDHVPDDLAWLVRYHSVLPAHWGLMDAQDRDRAERLLRPFSRYDHGTKSPFFLPRKRIDHYRPVIEKWLPETMVW